MISTAVLLLINDCLHVFRLQAAVYCPLVDEFIVALEQLNSPEQSWKDRCDNEIKPLMQCSQRDKEAIAKIWKRIYSSIFEQEAESMGQIAKRFAKVLYMI